MATMLRSKLLRSFPTSTLRAFTSSALCRENLPRSPSLGDITLESAAAFEAKQTKFREDLAATKRKKEQAESQLRDSSLDTEAPQNAHYVDNHITPLGEDVAAESSMGLGSLSINAGEQRQSDNDTTTTKRGSGKLSSFIYGTPEGRQMDKEMEQSFSQLLARGKYVHTIVFHDVKPDKVDEYVKLVGGWYPKVAANPDNKVNLVGSWRTEVGDSDTFGMSIKTRVYTS